MRVVVTVACIALVIAAEAEEGRPAASELRVRFEAGLEEITARQRAHRETLGREYLGRLARFERMARWRRTRAAEATAERKRFEVERLPLRKGYSSDPEVARLQAILAGAFQPLETEMEEATFALANAYLYRLANGHGRRPLRQERARLGREIGLPPAADGRIDLVPLDSSRIEILASSDRPGELRFQLGERLEGMDVSDARLRLVTSSRAASGGPVPVWHTLDDAAGRELARWERPATAFGVVLIDLTAQLQAIDAGGELQFALRPGGAEDCYEIETGGNPWSEARLLINDAAAAMAPRDAEGRPPAVEVLAPQPPEH